MAEKNWWEADNPKAASRANTDGVQEIGIAEKELIPLLTGEVESVSIVRGLATHTIRLNGKRDDSGKPLMSVTVTVSVPYSIVVAPAINGKKARIFFIGDVEKLNAQCVEGTCLVLTEANASLLYSNGACEQSKDGAIWRVVMAEDKQHVVFDGALTGRYKYRCGAWERRDSNKIFIDKLITERA